MGKSIYEKKSLTIKVRKPHVEIPEIPLSPRMKEVLEENDRIINRLKHTRRSRRLLEIH
jgi:hypothetical protein